MSLRELGLKQIRGKRALVTGAASGIGRGIALALAREGADVFVWDVNEPGLTAVVAEIRSLGVNAVGQQVDLTNSNEISAAVGSLREQWDSIEILVSLVEFRAHELQCLNEFNLVHRQNALNDRARARVPLNERFLTRDK